MEIALALVIVFCTSFVRSSVGFGDALLAMPLLALTVGLRTATPFFGLVAIVVGASILATSWHSVDLRAAWRLIVASALGIPLGLLLLTRAPESLVKGILGAGLIAFGAYNLIAPRLPQLARERWAYGFGFAAGVLGGAYNTNGPPVVIYAALRRWPPDRFRATMQAYFLPSSLLIAAGHGAAGLWTRDVLMLAALAAPAALLGVAVGAAAYRHIPVALFRRLIYGLLIAAGALMFV